MPIGVLNWGEIGLATRHAEVRREATASGKGSNLPNGPEGCPHGPVRAAGEGQLEWGRAAGAAGWARRNPRARSRRATTQSKPMPALGHRSDQARLKRVVPDGREPAR